MVISRFGMTFASAKDERFYRQTHPDAPYTQAVEKSFLSQYDKVAKPTQAQINTYVTLSPKYKASPVTGGSNIGQSPTGTDTHDYSPAPATPGSPLPTNNPPLDTRDPGGVVDNTGNTPATNVGSGPNNPLNHLELNSIVGVVAGLFFVRGAFKLLTKFF